MTPCEELNWTASSWRSTVSSRRTQCLLMENSLYPCSDLHCLLVEDFIVFAWKACWIDLNLAIDNNQFPMLWLVFLICAAFFCLLYYATFLSSSGLPPLDQYILVIPTLGPDFVDSGVTFGLSFHGNFLWRFIAFIVFVNCLVDTFVGKILYCRYFFTDVTVRLIFYFMATCFFYVTIGLPCLCQRYSRTFWPSWLLCWR